MPNDLLVEVALNVIGFAASGALLVVFYSMFSRKNKHESFLSVDIAATKCQVQSNEKIVEPRGKIEFVNFQANAGTLAKSNEARVQTIDVSSRFQRNRLEVVKQAKEMLMAGRGAADIRRNLPIAEAELNMINQQRNNWSRRGAANDQ